MRAMLHSQSGRKPAIFHPISCSVFSATTQYMGLGMMGLSCLMEAKPDTLESGRFFFASGSLFFAVGAVSGFCSTLFCNAQPSTIGYKLVSGMTATATLLVAAGAVMATDRNLTDIGDTFFFGGSFTFFVGSMCSYLLRPEEGIHAVRWNENNLREPLLPR